jgi:FkbM family methyltransferase
MSILERILRNLKDSAELGLSFPLRHISGLLGRKYHVTSIKGAGIVRIRPKSSDAQAFVDIFRDKAYDLSRCGQFPRVRETYQRILDSGQTPIIIDAGANVGAAAIWFSRQFPQATVLAIEPEVNNAEVCRLNTRDLPNIKVIEAAIGSEPGWVSLKNSENQAWAAQTTRNKDGRVAVCTIPEIVLAEQPPAKLFLVKIDIEGFEDDLFAKNVNWLDEAEVIVIEPHDWLFPEKGTSRNFQKAMATRSFEILISGDSLIYFRLPTDTARQ